MNGWQAVADWIDYNRLYCIAILGIGLAFSLKEKATALYLFILSSDFIFWDFAHSYLRDADPDKIYRYPVWASSEVILMFVIWVLASKKYTHPWIARLFTLAIFFSVFALFYRFIDRHFLDLPYAYEIIKNLPKYSNYAKVFIGYIGIGLATWKMYKEYRNVFGSNHDDDLFSARTFIFDKSNKKQL